MADRDVFKTGGQAGSETETGSDAELLRLFADARQAPPPMSEAFGQTLLADALTQMPAPQLGAAPQDAAPSGLGSLADAFGGWFGLCGSAGGAVCAGLVGLWLGFAPPATLETVTANLSPFATDADAEASVFASFDLAVVLQDTASGEE